MVVVLPVLAWAGEVGLAGLENTSMEHDFGRHAWVGASLG
jgi:hypothetical protein